MPDFSGFAATVDPTAAPGPLTKMPALPKLPGGGQVRPTIRPPVTEPDEPGPRSIDDVAPSRALDKPQLEEQAPPAGDDQMELDPTSDFPIPSTPNQGTPGDDQMNGPMFSNGVRQASLNSGATAAPRGDVRDAIVSAARTGGVNPALALATADRESSFNPNAGGTGTIKGLFQMTGGNRARYGQAEDADAAAQADAYVRFTNDNRATMRERLGREPSDAETYLGHYWGAGRAARMLGMDPQTPVGQVFTPRELATNPGLARAGTVGNAVGSVTSDMERRMSRYAAPQAAMPQGVDPDMDPNLTPAQRTATSEAQVPSVMKGSSFRPGADWDDAVASMPESEHVQDRRNDIPIDRKLREAKAHLEADVNPGLTPNQRVTDDFSRFGGQLAEDAGVNDVGITTQPHSEPRPGAQS